LRDAAIVAAVGIVSWLVIERTEICTRFFHYVAAHPQQELDSVILAGIFSALGMLVFALRRWADSVAAQRCSDRLAYHDPLTGLPNRRAFMRALEQASNPKKPPLACLLFDLDNFKQVNDLRGHLVGDELLRNLSARLLKALPPDVVCARVGGDEFGLLCPRAGNGDATCLAQLVVDLISEPVLIAGQLVKTSASVGLAGVPGDTRCAEDMLRQADIALYRAKALGRGAIQRFEPSMEQADRRHAAITDALRDAIPKGEIIPHYQPIVALTTGDVVGFEILSRWEGCILGSVGPAEFIPIAIESGLIDELCCNVLEQACRSATQWPTPLRISFNIAPVQICDPLLPTQLMAILSRSGLAPQRLEIELTEDALLSDDRAARDNLDFLTIQGITLALDDFGTGYSSLHHLRSLPFDKVKIDRSFVGKIVGCDKALRMVEAIIAFTHSLGIEVLAEGVETREQAALLKELGCDLAQGWLYGKPAANADLARHFERSVQVVKPPNALRA
jgi:diguanylate cyclase (GGDEF)-like protein